MADAFGIFSTINMVGKLAKGDVKIVEAAPVCSNPQIKSIALANGHYAVAVQAERCTWIVLKSGDLPLVNDKPIQAAAVGPHPQDSVGRLV
jgi:hypothetical protein